MIWHLIIIVLLTALTQLGGIAWLLALLTRFLGRFWIPFFVYYIALGITAHYTAPMTGREPLPCMDAGPAQIAVLNPLYCALNRHYVVPEMRDHADALAAHMHEAYPGTRTRALDAGFPFVDGFPLPPHLSHDDGQKLDLAFYYTDQSGEYQLGRASSFIGYWGFVQPREGDPQPCADQTGLNLRWDMAWLQPYLRDWPLDEVRTGEMLRWLAENPRGEGYRILIEPHLVQRLGVQNQNIGFQGCDAARHDDHIHLQFVP
ncbi:hypothetical protein [Yoonia sp. 2307UL14-13]|uniref:hypothetical protein n=1 Tax=Yoonia sp. 2307UL14-13 TaxID=3126506 RepID=UPI0030A36B3E